MFYSQLSNGAFILDDDYFSIAWKYPDGKYLFNYNLKEPEVYDYSVGEIVDNTDLAGSQFIMDVEEMVEELMYQEEEEPADDEVY